MHCLRRRTPSECNVLIQSSMGFLDWLSELPVDFVWRDLQLRELGPHAAAERVFVQSQMAASGLRFIANEAELSMFHKEEVRKVGAQFLPM